MAANWMDVLDSRENRAERQQKWISQCKLPLVSFTLNIPGPCKQSALYARIHEEGLDALSKMIPVHRMEKWHLETGSEALLNTSIQAYHLKSITVNLEEHHPLGRFFDIDVIDKDGSQITRSDINLPKRRCLICDEEAKVCTRNRTHRLEDLLDIISSIAETYFRHNDASQLKNKQEVSL